MTSGSLARLAVLTLSIASSLFAQSHGLPKSFTTISGKTIQNGSVTSRTEDSIKVMHDGGITTIRHNDLPKEVCETLGITIVPTEEAATDLPNPFTAGHRSFDRAQITGVDPDGIRITHSSGAAKVRYEDLPDYLLSQVGPFDSKRAEEFRLAEQERNRIAYAAVRQAKEDLQRAATNAIIADQEALDAQKQALLADPSKVSSIVNVRLAASSTGGKSRDTTWQTSYGSYDRTDTSKRTMVCTISSRSSGFQRVRLQCLFLTRDVSGSRALQYEVATDALVDLGPQVTKTVVAGASTEQSDEKYVMLGLRLKEGAKYVGWTWRAIDGQGRICAVHSSVPAYDRYSWQTPVE